MNLAGESHCSSCGEPLEAPVQLQQDLCGRCLTDFASATNDADSPFVLDQDDSDLVAELRLAYEYKVSNSHALDDSIIRQNDDNAQFLRPIVEPPEIGTSLDDFELVQEIGRGGMGIVYRALQKSLGREVAVKVLPGFAHLSPSAVRRFVAEAEAAAKLYHTNIVSVHAQGESKGQYYYAMELIEGCSLDVAMHQSCDWIRADKSTSHAKAVNNQPYQKQRTTSDFRSLAKRLATIADALELAHSQKVIHRDVKPQNILIDRQGNLYLTDFGLARLTTGPNFTHPGDMMGTPSYMAPEQVKGQNSLVDARTDVYAMGATLYEVLTGERPFTGESRDEVLLQIVSHSLTEPRKKVPTIPHALETICLQAMAPERDDRYATAADLRDDLRRFSEGKRIRASRDGLVRKTRKWIKANRAKAISLSAIVVAMISIGLSWATVRQSRENAARDLVRTAYARLVYDDYRALGTVADDLDNARAKGIDDEELYLPLALAAMGRSDETEARQHLNALLTKNPEDLRGLYLLAWAEWRERNSAESAQLVKRADEVASENPDWQSADSWFFRGLAVHFSEPQEAVESYRNAIRVRMDEFGFFPQAVLNLARARNQQLYATRQLDTFAEAVDSLKQLVEHKAYGAYPHYLLSVSYRLAAEIYEGSHGTRDESIVRDHYQESLDWARLGQQVDAADDRPTTSEAECLESMGLFSEAAEARTRAIDVATKDVKKWEGYHYRWRLRFWLGDHEGALSDLQQCRVFDDSHIGYKYTYPALVLASDGNRTDAVDLINELVNKADGNPQKLIWAATAFRLMGMPNEADKIMVTSEETLDFSLALSPPQTEKWMQLLWKMVQGTASEDDLIIEAESASQPWRLTGEASFHSGAMHLVNGDRNMALASFDAARRSYDSELRYAYHGKLLWNKMRNDPAWPDWLQPK